MSSKAKELYRRGLELQDAGRITEACDQYRAAVAADPLHAKAHNNLGALLHSQGDFSAAVSSYQRALAADPGLAQARRNLPSAWLELGGSLEAVGDFRQAIGCYRSAIALEPGSAAAHFGLALQLLLAGDWAAGWEEYEWRWKLPELASLVPAFAEPAWNGESLAGRTILLFTEQGFGDVMQFARFIPDVERQARRVLVRCPASLQRLLERSYPASTIVSDLDPLPRFDAHCALLSLPRRFGTRTDTIPGKVPYLIADPAAVARRRGEVAAHPGRIKAGLCWASDSRSGPGKSMLLQMLAPLGKVPGVVFFNLQKGAPAGQAAQPPAGMRLVQPEELRDFDDTAALTANLDLVISVDTAVAHLAGAMAKPAWTLTPFPPDWRWRLQGEDSAWYPTMRLFRQRQANDWTPVIERVAAALREFVP